MTVAAMKHLRILNYVDEVARTGSIRKAAGRLNVTASAVNRAQRESGAPQQRREIEAGALRMRTAKPRHQTGAAWNSA